ncbi:GT-D fold domain-containing glycosyltransferase [Exilibacterium tricleocarpae]|uniref:GT-D fold domain-containing glycosyltransferase n=1 Tax=Exilibacterium tricleocarpae TaxID=2591008 RepID=UPI0015D3FD28|nr:GT-D fold domain-containing glycosyltransferase [Exilibacterium tricleocarpae]
MHTDRYWEKVLGSDLEIPRGIVRKISSLFVGLVPIKSWRTHVRNKIDDLVIRLHRKKIEHFVHHYPKVRTETETIQKILAERKSIARFGDGEFNLCIGITKAMQKYDLELVARLKQILNTSDNNILIGINTINSENDLTKTWKKFIIRRGNRVLRLFNCNRTYDSSTITTIFPSQKEAFDSYIELLKQVWHNRKVVFVVGKNSHFFFEEDLFHNIAQHEFIYAPGKNAFEKYDHILSAIKQYDTSWLIMLSLGPTATLLAYDLSKSGYQAIDLGKTPSNYKLAKNGVFYLPPPAG